MPTPSTLSTSWSLRVLALPSAGTVLDLKRRALSLVTLSTPPPNYPQICGSCYLVHNGEMGSQPVYGTWVFPPQAPSSPSVPAGFTDLKGYGWAAPAIGGLTAMGILRGVGHGRFDPAGHLTRAQVAALVVRVFHLQPPAHPTSFIDVTPSAWFHGDVAAAAPFMGSFPTPSGRAFKPGRIENRFEFAATLRRILVSERLAPLPSAVEAQAVWSGFHDTAGLEQKHPLASRDAALVVQKVLMTGYGDGRFGPGAPLNRVEAAVVVWRVEPLLAENQTATPPVTP